MTTTASAASLWLEWELFDFYLYVCPCVRVHRHVPVHASTCVLCSKDSLGCHSFGVSHLQFETESLSVLKPVSWTSWLVNGLPVYCRLPIFPSLRLQTGTPGPGFLYGFWGSRLGSSCSARWILSWLSYFLSPQLRILLDMFISFF